MTDKKQKVCTCKSRSLRPQVKILHLCTDTYRTYTYSITDVFTKINEEINRKNTIEIILY